MATRSDNYWLSSAEQAQAVTPSDTVDLALKGTGSGTKQLYVGGTGDIKVALTGQKDSEAVTLKAVPTGTMLPFSVRRVFSTGTTATLLIAVY